METPHADQTLPDPLAEESLALAGISSASVLGRVALGRRAGVRVLQLGAEVNAHLEGFDLHANLLVPADDRARLDQLCRNVVRPPVGRARLRLTADARVLVELKSEWTDGTTLLLFEPLELLEKLAALTPRPRINLVLCHGILAPHARRRSRAVAYTGPEPVPEEEPAAPPWAARS